MKKTVSILLLLLFFLNITGFYIVLNVRQYQIRKEIKDLIKQNLPDKELSLIIITEKNRNDLIWEDENEFRYKGIMYDIVRKKFSPDGTVYYYCITDHKETSLFANLDNHLEKNTENPCSKNPAVKKLTRILSPEYFPAFNSLEVTTQNMLSYPSFFLLFLSSRNIVPPFPPPEKA